MSDFNLKDPEWIPKAVNDFQTAVEMNQVIGDFKTNVAVLRSLILKLAPDQALQTTSKVYSGAINELHLSIVENLKTPKRVKILKPGVNVPFPKMKKGEGNLYEIMGVDVGAYPKSSTFWMGGLGQVLVGHKTWLICLENSDGGSFNAVGHKYLLINQNAEADVLMVESLPPPSEVLVGVIYVLISSNAMYIWNTDTEQFDNIGDILPGTLVDATTFLDEFDQEVTPMADKLYFDQNSQQYYRWNGISYVLMNSSSATHYTEKNIFLTQAYPEIGITGAIGFSWTQKLFNEKIVEYLKTKGIGKSITANVSGAYNIDLAAMVEHYNLTFIENSSIGFTNMIGTNQSVVKTLTLTGQKSWLLPSYLVALPNNDDYDGSVLNQVVINITKGGANPAGYYSLINMT